jgi:hypothetical protein
LTFQSGVNIICVKLVIVWLCLFMLVKNGWQLARV